jgi:hypothetical protein
MQLETNKIDESRIFEWIPYNQFSNIKKMNNDNFIKIYSAVWNNDFWYYDNLYKKEKLRRLKLKVTLKYLQNITDEVIFYKTDFNKAIYTIFNIIIFNVNRLIKVQLVKNVEYLKILLQKIIF